ncbi:MAG: hypothetical protein QOE91_794 [Gaiellaceae bacterium]|nr:hypothetical protein [Gaiellaceae bacterium]
MQALTDRARGLAVTVGVGLVALAALVAANAASVSHHTKANCAAGYTSATQLGESAPFECVAIKHPESTMELINRQLQLQTVRSAPYASVASGAYANALTQGAAVAKQGKTRDTAGAWQPYGHGPLIANDPRYTSVNGLGLVYNEGRTDSIKYDAGHNRLFVAKGTGGIWMSTDLGNNWRSIGESLPSQVVGAIGWTDANGGTVIAVSGDPSYGAGGYTGYGAFWSTDLGTTWNKATGIPDSALGFAIEADPANPNIVYAGTSFGLYRSTDGGQSYVNVSLPTGSCAGVPGSTTGRPECQLANMVTDVVVKYPGGVNEDVSPGTVIAAVGWRAGTRTNADGTVQSPGNGLYRSSTGAPGTFSKVVASGFPAQDRIGRVELGAASGANQDHDYLYAIVQDAAVLNGQLDVVDSSGVPDPRGAQGTVLNGVYVSADFGKTWTLMADDNAIAKNPATGSALVGYGQATGYEPGVQAWYDMWIAPDPTRQSASGIPTRLAFGLEEVWQNELTSVPMNGPATFKVIGRYFSGTTCIFLSLGLPECPTNRPPTTSTTTHPDQQDGLWIPDGTGGVTLAVGNDGGFYRNHVATAGELDNGGWGDGNDNGMNTLLPYDVAIANDGTVWAGLQDNGHMRIAPDGKQYETYGGDGTFAEVDPKNSDVAYEAYVYNAMKVTTDGGKSWRAIAPTLTNTRFVTPFQMDPRDANHLVTGGNEIVETTAGPNTADGGADHAWAQVYDLGTAQHPGDAAAAPSASDPANGMSAIDVKGDAVYAGFCGVCDILNATAPFHSGIATNVGGTKAPKRMTSDGWHIAAASGLPNRFVTAVTIDPNDIHTVYVAMGGYSRRWVPPGSLQDKNTNVGTGHVFVSHDAGQTFTDISGNLPDAPATSIVLRLGQVIVGTDVGVFASPLKGGTTYSALTGLPNVPISMLNLKPDNPNILFAATFGRSIWTYTFSRTVPMPPPGPGPEPPPPAANGTTFAGPFGFELGDDGWTAQSTSPTSTWKRAAPGAGSTTSFQNIPYTDAATSTLRSPALTSTGGWVYVNFNLQTNTEPGFDFVNVDWSSDGTTWNAAKWAWDATTSTWVNNAAFTGMNNSYPGFDATRVALNAPAGPLYLRFRLSSDELISSPLYTGAAVDDVSIAR